jgi:glyoxylase-like metal-dependent hydrolase (beta-lactamase superfamily II)
MRTVKALIAIALFASPGATGSAQRPAASPKALRLYVFDCGRLEGGDVSRFRLTRQEMATTDMSVACYLVAHPKGTLVWDAGAVPDREIEGEAVKPGAGPKRYRIVLPNSTERFVTAARTLKSQLAASGYTPADITYLALSHYHYDHTANANEFAASTWLVRPIERDAMFADKPPDLLQPATYSALRSSRTISIKTDDYDVFGDGTVVLKLAPGHTPGHQVLFLKLAKTGPVVVSGDLYHYPEERTLNRIPTFDADQRQTAASRAALDVFLKKAGAQLWIQHDFNANAKLRKAPSYYE